MPVPVQAVRKVKLLNVKGPWLREGKIETLAVMVENAEIDEIFPVGEFPSVVAVAIDKIEAQGDDETVGPTNEVETLVGKDGECVVDGVNVGKTMTASDSETDVLTADDENEAVGVAIKVPLLIE